MVDPTPAVTSTVATNTTTNVSPFTVGDYTIHDIGGTHGYITTINLMDATTSIKYAIGNIIIHDIPWDECHLSIHGSTFN